MKKLLFLFLFGTIAAFAQYPTINTVSTPGLGVGVPAGANFSDAAIHVKATDNDLYANGGGQQIFFAETTASSAAGDYFRIMNASGSNSRFAPLVSGFGRSHNLAPLQLMGLASVGQDFGNSALINFTAALDFTPKTSQEAFVNGSDVVNRPLFQWRNNQTPRMTMLANGSLGLGTVAPTASLHSVGTARLESLPSSSSNTDIITSDSFGNLASRSAASLFTSGWNLTGNTVSSSDFLGTLNAADLTFKTASNTRMTIDALGKVGIGIAAPTAGLHIVGGSNADLIPANIKLDRNDGTNQAGLLTIGISGNSFASGLLGGGSASFKLTDPYGNSANSDMGFGTNGLAAQFVIKHNGFIGAGTESPTANFHSVGTARLQGLPTSSSNTDIVTSDASGNLALTTATSLLSSAWNLAGNTVSSSDFLGTNNAQDLNFKTSALQRMTIDASGKVGVGTTAPNAAIHVVGGSNAGMLPPRIMLDRNDATNQAGLLTIGISGNSFASGLLGGGSAAFRLTDPYGNSANSDMGFGTNGLAAQFVIKHNGFIGAGTESPTANFHSVGTARLQGLPSSSSNTIILTTDASGNISSQSASSLFPASTGWNLTGNAGTVAGTNFIGTTDATDLAFRTNNIDRAVITSAGNMGIGTSLPTAKLEATSTPSSLTPAIKGNGVATGVYGEATDMILGQTAEGIANGLVEAVGVFGKGTYASFSGNGNVYGVVGSATAANPLNNVGVYGEAKNAIGYNTGMYGTVNSSTGIYNAGVTGVVTLNTTAAWNRAIEGRAPVAPNHYAGYFDGNVDMQSGTVRIGNVSTPAGYKLYVEQGILTEKVKVALSSSLAWADYVFAKDYKLQPLAEVESFINTNKHLPNMPSATELAKEGLDLGKMQAKQMEKIEELTLYLIQMQKEIETLKKQNKLLKSKN